MLNEQKRFGLGQAEGQDSLRQPIMRDYNNKSNGEQVKETVPTWSQQWLFPITGIYTHIYIYILIHCAVQQKIIQHCKATVLQKYLKTNQKTHTKNKNQCFKLVLPFHPLLPP